MTEANRNPIINIAQKRIFLIFFIIIYLLTTFILYILYKILYNIILKAPVIEKKEHGLMENFYIISVYICEENYKY